MELFQPGHLIPLLIIAAILFFGWKQLPDMSRSLGRSLRIFKTEIKGMSEDDKAREAAREAARDAQARDAERPAIEAAPTTHVAPAEPQPAPPAQAQVVPPRPRPRPQNTNQA